MKANNKQLPEPPIGGEIELSFKIIDTLLNAKPVSFLPNTTSVMSGRSGLRLIARAIKMYRDGPVLLPSYLCQSMIEPFLIEKLTVKFFPVSSNLTPDMSAITELVESLRPSAILFINYFGFPVHGSAYDTLKSLKEYCWLIEDCSQGSLVEKVPSLVGYLGDFVITSFRKYLPLPDGGVVINRSKAVLAELHPTDERYVYYRLIAKILREESLRENFIHSDLKKMAHKLFAEAEQYLDKELPLQTMSLFSKKLLGTLDLAQGMVRRRNNFKFLLQSFQDNPELQLIGVPLFTKLPDGVSPLLFPLRVSANRRDALQRQLIALRVFCPIHWKLPKTINPDIYVESNILSHEILGLPIDQRYDEGDMKSLLRRFSQAGREVL